MTPLIRGAGEERAELARATGRRADVSRDGAPRSSDKPAVVERLELVDVLRYRAILTRPTLRALKAVRR